MLVEKAHFEVRAMCRVFGIAPSTYYGWEREQQCERAVRDEQLLTSVQRIFAEYRGATEHRACGVSCSAKALALAASASPV